MIKIDKIFQGDTFTQPFVVYQDDGVTPDPLSLYANIMVEYKHIESDAVLEKYAMAAETGYITADFHITSSDDGTFELTIQSSVTATAKKGEYKAVIELRKTNSDFDDGYSVETLEEKSFIIQ